MILNYLFWLAACGLTVAFVSATGVKMFHDFSHRELEAYCLRRGRRELFGQILDQRDRVVLAAETLQIAGGVTAALCGGWWLVDPGRPLASPERSALLAVAAITTLLLVAVVWAPAAVARIWSAPFLFHTWRLWRLASRLLWPLTAGGSLVEALLRRLAERPKEQPDEEEAFEDEIRAMVRTGLHEGLLEEGAREMIEGVIDLGDTDVSDVMTPRSKIDAIDADLNWPEVLEYVIQTKRTRIPVYENTLDHVIGVLYVKDLLPELANKGKTDEAPSGPLRSLLRKPWFVPMTNAVDEMLQEFLRTRNHLAIVVDEYRAVAGVVTIEDVLEEIVGEIVDEYDQDVEEDIRQLNDSTLEAAGRTHLDELNDHFGIGLPDPDDYDTIGGFIISQLGRIPEAGESIVYNNVRITVLQSNRRRIDRVRLARLTQPDREAAATP